MERAGQVIPGDTVIGVFDQDRLSDVLPVLHRERYGQRARVMSPERGPLTTQLRRAGLPDIPELEGEKRVSLLVVSAPGRAMPAAHLLAAHGARQVYVTTIPAAGALPQPMPFAETGELAG